MNDTGALDRRFDAVLIDFYGTICAGDREAVLTACRGIVETCRLPIAPDQFAIRWGERFFELTGHCNHDSFRTLHECEVESLRVTLDEFGVENDPTALVAPLEQYWRSPRIYPDALGFLAGVDRPICCVSNADSEPLRTAMEHLGLSFDAVVTSEEVRSYKPDPAIFRRALSTLDVTPERTLHIGDSLHSDIAGAAAVGITAVWICRKSRIHDIGCAKPDFTIGDLTAALGVLRR